MPICKPVNDILRDLQGHNLPTRKQSKSQGVGAAVPRMPETQSTSEGTGTGLCSCAATDSTPVWMVASVLATCSKTFSWASPKICHEKGSFAQWESTFTQFEIVSSRVSPPNIPNIQPKERHYSKHSSKGIFLGHNHRHVKHHTFIFPVTSWKWWCRHQLLNGYRNCVFYTLEIWFSWATVVQHLVSLTLLTLLSVTDFCFPGS